MMHVGIDVVLKCNLAQAISFLNKVEVYPAPGDSNCRILFKKKHSEEFVREKPYSLVTSKTGLQRPAARYDGIGKIGGGYGLFVSMVSRVVSRCPWLPKFVPCYLKWSLVA